MDTSLSVGEQRFCSPTAKIRCYLQIEISDLHYHKSFYRSREMLRSTWKEAGKIYYTPEELIA
jgi:hypothetical protein